MTKFRTLVFLYLISLTGFLWSVFIAWYAGYFLEGAMMVGLIVLTNMVIAVTHYHR